MLLARQVGCIESRGVVVLEVFVRCTAYMYRAFVYFKLALSLQC